MPSRDAVPHGAYDEHDAEGGRDGAERGRSAQLPSQRRRQRCEQKIGRRLAPPVLLLRDARWRRAALGLFTQLLHQRQHGGIGRGAHLFLQERFVRSSVLDGCGGLARSHERRHEAECGLGAERIECSEPAPPVGRGAVVALRRGSRC